MTTTEYVFVIILCSLLSVFLVLLIAAVSFSIKILLSVKGLVAKAENAISTAEEAADIFKEASGKMAIVKIVSNIIKMVNRK